MNDILNLSVAQLKRAIAIKEQIQSLEVELASILGKTSAPAPAAVVTAPASPKKKVMSPAARAKISAAATARWAKVKAASAAPAAPAKAPAAAPKKKRKLSAEGRARIVAALKARWAKKRKAAK